MKLPVKLPLKRPVKIKGHLRDLIAFRELVPIRRQRLANASRQPVAPDPMLVLVDGLHPARQLLVIAAIRQETPTCRTYTLIPDQRAGATRLAYFRAGQYLSLKLEVAGAHVTRPYSISSAPDDALAGRYEITVKLRESGLVTPHLWRHWEMGTQVVASGPAGDFYYDPLRDRPHLVGLAGGCGVTPFRSMAREIVAGTLDARLTLLYGSVLADEIIFKNELAFLAERAPDKLRVVHVLSGRDEATPGCESGFLNADLIERQLTRAEIDDASFFVCGPQVMYEFLHKEAGVLGVPSRRIRRELFGEPLDITGMPRFPRHLADERFAVTVRRGRAVHQISAAARESLLVALERAGVAPDSACRSGACALCRVHVSRGQVYVSPETDGRRAADKAHDFVHACASYPVSDLEIEIPT